MTTAIPIEDVRKEVKILRALTRHNNLIQFYDAYEDHDNVYLVMELCEGGGLLDRILSRGGKHSEDDANTVMMLILLFLSAISNGSYTEILNPRRVRASVSSAI